MNDSRIYVQEEDGTIVTGATVTYNDGVTTVSDTTDVEGKVILDTSTLTAPYTLTIEYPQYKTYTHIVTDSNYRPEDIHETIYKQIPVLTRKYDGVTFASLYPSNPINYYYD